jgi:ABC-type nickel/cobalt efflux system permease component RcnA
MHCPRTIVRVALLALPLFLRLAHPQAAEAHPMGNFSISHYSEIHVGPAGIEVRYFIDMAEIPAYQEIQDNGLVTAEGDAGLREYLVKKAKLLAGGLTLQVNGRQLHLRPISQNIIFPAGAGGLPTMKCGFVYRAAMGNVSSGTVRYRDTNFEGRAGWKEIVVTAEPAFRLTASSAPQTDRSAQLSNYPTDLLNSPPQDLEAGFSFSSPLVVTENGPRPGLEVAAAAAHNEPAPAKPPKATSTSATPAPPMPSISLRANRQATPRNRFTELVTTRDLSFWFLFTAALIAAGLGALHALEPGHGKTIVAAYLVGSRGTARHAVFLGLIVTGAHTAGVYLLGVVTLGASKYIVPDQLYPWLGMVSGIVIAIFAAYLMIRAWTSDDGAHSHNHWFDSNRGAAQGPAAKQVSLTQLLTLGITGGMVPCPAALVVLLGAFSMHRVGFGLFLIVAFSLGLAAVLVLIGLFMVYARQFVARWQSEGAIMKRWLPVASAGFMMILGLGIAGRALLSTGAGAGFLAQAKLPSFLGIVLLGLFLGMRHSTDPDHVIAVSTIASRERSVGQGAMIGVLWGVGHTLTIFVVGSAIILFGLSIPPRVGLSMEFSVALMLILLGVLNLTGALRWLAGKFGPADRGTTPETAGNPPDGFLERLMSRYGSYQVFRPLMIGLVHGLAGSAAVALLVLSTIRSPLWAIAYLLVFGTGTVAGMMLMTSAMAIPVAWTGKHFEAAGRYLSPLSGIVSTGFGLFLAYQICFVDGLFRAGVHWTPQ